MEELALRIKDKFLETSTILTILNNISTTTTTFSTTAFTTTNTTLFTTASPFITTTEDFIEPDEKKVSYTYEIAEVFNAMMAVLGNGLVIVVFFYEKRLRTNLNYQILSLAFADFIFGLIGIPMAIAVRK